jgi:hypothetical protein
MSGPDGPEERTAFYEEAFERDIDEQDVREQLADDDTGYHTNEYGEIIAHAVTVEPIDVAPIMDKIKTAVRL